jgi:putative cell wall-binding protein
VFARLTSRRGGALRTSLAATLSGGLLAASIAAGGPAAAGAPTSTRLFGADRYATATAITSSYFGSGVPVVYVAAGTTYPDALAGGPAAALQGGPLLLVAPDSIPATVAAELTRLQPQQIVLLGGTAAVSSAVESQLAGYTSGQVTRVAGADRYDTAAQLAGRFSVGSPVFVVDGLAFPDALAGTAAAIASHAAVLLTQPGQLPAATIAALTALQPSSITILGGTSVVSTTVETQLAAYSASVSRIAGADRYATAAAIVTHFFPAATQAYVTSGEQFADALAGGEVAGLRGEPLLLSSPTCVPSVTSAAEPDLTAITLLGGTAALSDAVASWTPCPVAPPAYRLTFYYPWYPTGFVNPGSNYHPSDGQYSTADPAELSKQVAEMRYAGLNGAIFSWWGQSDVFSQRLPVAVAAAHGTPFQWSAYYEPEGQGNPSVAQIQSDLNYLYSQYAGDPNWLHIDGKPVIFVWPDGTDNCAMLDRWAAANANHAWYVVQKVFYTQKYTSCASQPDAWHEYAPANRTAETPWSFAVSPGFWKKGEASPRLGRDVNAFDQAVKQMKASNAQFQLVTTWNEWIEGTSIESAQEWASASDYGAYVDVLHAELGST